MNKDNNNNSDYFDKDAYDFIRFISSPPSLSKEQKPHKKRYAVVFLIVFSIVFIAAAKHTYIEDTPVKSARANIQKPVQTPETATNDSPALCHLSQQEIDERLLSLSRSDSRYKTIYSNRDVYPSDMLQAVCQNPETVDFALGYLDRGSQAPGEIDDNDLNGDIPLFLQWDKRWGYEPYGDNVIGLSGCGPACLSMTAVYLTGNTKYTPGYIAAYAARHGYYEKNTGTSWELFNSGCKAFGIKSKELPLNYTTIANTVKEKKPIICSMYPGDFTASGHFIVIRGIDENGDFILNDPNSKARSQRHWSYDELEWQIRNLWAFET